MTSLVIHGRVPRGFARSMLVAALAQELSDQAASARNAARSAAAWIAAVRGFRPSQVVGPFDSQLANPKARG